MTTKGRFVVFEGLDGCGKSTQAKRLAEWLKEQKREVWLTAEPTHDGPIGPLIRQVLRGEAEVPPAGLLHLFLADRATHTVKIEAALAEGVTVVCDRYVMSTIAYQSAVISAAQLAVMNERFPKPDLTVLLNVPVKTCLARIAERKGATEVFETPERLERIERAFQTALSEVRARKWNVASMSGMDDVGAVEKRVRLEVARMFERG